MPLQKIKEGLGRLFGKEPQSEYIEIDLGEETKKKKINVRPFILKKFDDVNDILNPLKKKDMIELKRSIAKIKKTADALEGEVAGFGEGMIIVTPSFAQIYRPKQPVIEKKQPLEMY